MVGNIPTGRESDGPLQYPVELAHSLGSPLPGARGSNWVLGQVEDRAGFKFRAAMAAHRNPGADCFISTSEQVGFPLALLNRGRRRHIMLAHNLTTRFKDQLHRRLGFLNWIDEIVVFSGENRRHLVDNLGIDPDRVHLLDHPVDTNFFTPIAASEVDQDLIVAVGREHRDYPTLIDAMRGLPEHRAVIVANSPWAKGSGTDLSQAEPERLPDNVRVVPWLDALQLRDLYSRAAVVALPLLPDVRFGAGSSSLSEAQSMGTPVVASAVAGIKEYLDPSCVVSTVAGDPDRLSEGIKELLDDRHLRNQMGVRAREVATSHRSLSTFVAAMRAVVGEDLCPSAALEESSDHD